MNAGNVNWGREVEHKDERAKRAEVLARESAMRSLGLAKVRGSLGGTYWE